MNCHKKGKCTSWEGDSAKNAVLMVVSYGKTLLVSEKKVTLQWIEHLSSVD